MKEKYTKWHKPQQPPTVEEYLANPDKYPGTRMTVLGAGGSNPDQDLIKSSKGKNGSEPTDWEQATDWWGYAIVVFFGLFAAFFVAHLVAFVNSAIV